VKKDFLVKEEELMITNSSIRK